VLKLFDLGGSQRATIGIHDGNRRRNFKLEQPGVEAGHDPDGLQADAIDVSQCIMDFDGDDAMGRQVDKQEKRLDFRVFLLRDKLEYGRVTGRLAVVKSHFIVPFEHPDAFEKGLCQGVRKDLAGFG